MQIKENSAQSLVLSDTPWWAPLIGVVVGAFCFWSAATQMADDPAMKRIITILFGLVFLGVTTLAIRRTLIQFDRSAGTITRTTQPLLPLGKIHLFRARSESRPLQPIKFAYLEKQIRGSGRSPETAQPIFCLALATGEIPEEVLTAQTAYISQPDMDKVRWLVGYNAGMKFKEAQKKLDIVNQWLGTSAPTTL